MQNVEIIVNAANSLIRSANVDYDNLSRANSVTRLKIERTLRSTLEELNSKILEIQTIVTQLPIHEKPRYTQVINRFKNEHTRLSSFPKASPSARPNIELHKIPSTEYSSMSESDLIRSQKELQKKQEIDLDALSVIANNTKNRSKDIGDELSLHNNLLDRTQANVDFTIERIEKVNKKLDRFMNAVDRCQYSCLLCVILGLMLLIILTLFIF